MHFTAWWSYTDRLNAQFVRTDSAVRFREPDRPDVGFTTDRCREIKAGEVLKTP